MPLCVTFTPEGEDPPKDALECRQVEVDGKKGTGCIHLDSAGIQPAQGDGVPTEKAAARFAPRLVEGAELTDEQREKLEQVHGEIAADLGQEGAEAEKSADEKQADKLFWAQLVGTAVFMMSFANPVLAIGAGLATYYGQDYLEDNETAEGATPVEGEAGAAQPADTAEKAEGAAAVEGAEGSSVIPEGSIAVRIHWKNGKPRVDEEDLIQQLVLGSPLVIMAISTNEDYLGEVFLFAEKEAAKHPGQKSVTLNVADIEARIRERMQAKMRARMPQLAPKPEGGKAEAAAAAPKGKKGGRRGGGKGKKAKKAKKKSGGGMYDDF